MTMALITNEIQEAINLKKKKALSKSKLSKPHTSSGKCDQISDRGSKQCSCRGRKRLPHPCTNRIQKKLPKLK